jgi:hypothetical protein
MKRFVSLAFVFVASSVFGQQIAKNAPPDLLARDSAAPVTASASSLTPSEPTPKFLSVAATEPATTGTAEAMVFTPVPKFTEQKPVFHKKIFISEMAVYTAANVLDGITTVRGVRRGFTESAWPRGSSELLGLRPGIGRYTATMGAMQLGAMFASYRLQHSQNRYLRMMGHSLMMEGIVDHTMGFASNLNLPSQPAVQ